MNKIKYSLVFVILHVKVVLCHINRENLTFLPISFVFKHFCSFKFTYQNKTNNYSKLCYNLQRSHEIAILSSWFLALNLDGVATAFNFSTQQAGAGGSPSSRPSQFVLPVPRQLELQKTLKIQIKRFPLNYFSVRYVATSKNVWDTCISLYMHVYNF